MGSGGKSADAAKDRRAQSGQRVHFEAMVAVGGAEGGAAFEAESVDVSSQGMRLRTAYLPVVGDQLVCRFDGPDGELIAVGEVLWATEQQKGGEFGLKFVDLDPATEQALKALSVHDAIQDAEPEHAAAKPKVARNARVKLHIEGLASPMKARVRDGDDKEVCVGSSLEFLKLGRQVEVEDVDVGDRREGFVDAVKVEVDPATSVPQLVVTLRFDAARLGAAAPSRIAREDKLQGEIEPAPVTRAAGTPPPSKRGDMEAPKASRSGKKETKAAASVIAPEVVSAADASAEDDDDMLPPNKLRAAQDRAKDFTNMAASRIGPAFSKVGAGARGFLASIRGNMDKRREAREEAKKASAPRRVTAPPPSGALTSEGRRVVRQDQGKDADDEPVSVSPKRSRKGIVLGAAAGLVLVLGIVGATKALDGNGEAAPQGSVSSADAKKGAPGVPPIPGAAATAEVPLFGATPLSTTEQVIAQPQPSGAAKASAADVDDGDGEVAEKSELVREWGHGELKNAKTFKVKMDAAVEGFSANEQDDGFSIVVPKRQSMSTSSALVRKDKRLSAVDVENREDGVEIRMKFKGEPPAYRVKVRSDRVEISLGGEGTSGKAAAPAKKADPKKVAAKPKPASKKKKTDKKAPAAKKP